MDPTTFLCFTAGKTYSMQGNKRWFCHIEIGTYRKLPKMSHFFPHTHILVQRNRSLAEQSWQDWHVYQLLFEIWLLAGCKKKVCSTVYECFSIFLTSIFMSDLLLHLFKTFLLNFLTTQFLQIHPSIKAKNSLHILYLFVKYEKKNHIQMKIMAGRDIFFILQK